MNGILGKKIGMTNIFNQEGRFIPVTLIEAGPCLVVGTKTNKKHGYSALILGYGEVKESRVNMPKKKWFKKLKLEPKKTIKEIRTDNEPSCKVGDKITVNVFKNGDFVDVMGISIGKGFQGGVKRWKWSGGESGHGSMFHRAPGSIGASSYPSRVFKGQHLPGHMGAVRKTIQNLEVVSIDEASNILAVKGAVPGHTGTLLVIKNALKKPTKDEGKQPKDVKKDENKK